MFEKGLIKIVYVDTGLPILISKDTRKRNMRTK